MIIRIYEGIPSDYIAQQSSAVSISLIPNDIQSFVVTPTPSTLGSESKLSLSFTNNVNYASNTKFDIVSVAVFQKPSVLECTSSMTGATLVGCTKTSGNLS